MTGDTVSARVSSNPDSALDGHSAEQLDHSGASQSSTAPGKAEQLPQRMWIIVVAGLFVWTIIAIGALLFFV